MIFEFTERAKEFIDKKNIKEFTIARYATHCCCAKGIPMAVANAGVPTAQKFLYKVHEVSDPKLTLYVDRYLDFVDNKCVVDLEKYLMAENLAIKNLTPVI